MQVEVLLYNDAVPRGRERESETRPGWAVLFALLRGVCSPSDRAEVQRGGDFQLTSTGTVTSQSSRKVLGIQLESGELKHATWEILYQPHVAVS